MDKGKTLEGYWSALDASGERHLYGSQVTDQTPHWCGLCRVAFALSYCGLCAFHVYYRALRLGRLKERGMNMRLPVIQHLGNRASALKVTEFCGQAGLLAEEYNISIRAGATSTAFHGVCSNAPNLAALLARLTPEERAEIETWHRPTDVDLGVEVLRYDDAEKEIAVGLDELGQYVDPDQKPALIPGHLDMGWVKELPIGRVAFVGDIKRESYTAESPDILQLHAYGRAYAKKNGCRFYITGIWVAKRGYWVWSETPVDLRSQYGRDMWERLRLAGANIGGEYSTGAHCRGCYSRLQCPAFTLPAVLAQTELAAFVRDGEITPDGLTRAVLLAEQLKDLAAAALETAKEAVRRGAVVRDPATGKVWKVIECQGRETADTKALRAAGLGEYVRRGQPYDRPQWCKP